MLRSYVAAGFDPSQFWGLSPRLYLAHMRGASERVKAEQENRAWLAWNIAALPRFKKFPDAADFIYGNGVERGGDVVMKLAALRVKLPKITQEEYRARWRKSKGLD